MTVASCVVFSCAGVCAEIVLHVGHLHICTCVQAGGSVPVAFWHKAMLVTVGAFGLLLVIRVCTSHCVHTAAAAVRACLRLLVTITV